MNDSTITAVQKVLYERTRLRRLEDDLHTIVVFMNLDSMRPLPTTDPRIAGAGPTWYIPATGALSSAVVESAARCDRIAATFLAIRRDLAKVRFPAADKAQLRLALAEQAAAWAVRAKAWRAPPTQDIDATVSAIERHLQASANAFGKARKYLKKVRLG